MSKYSIEGSTLTDIADAIRSKTGDTAALTAAAMAEAIASISGGGGGNLVKKYKTAKTSDNETISFTGLDAEPLAYVLMIYQSLSLSSDAPRYLLGISSVGEIGIYVTPSSSKFSVSSAPLVFFGTKRVEAIYNNGTLTINILDTSSVGQLATKVNYHLSYVYLE